MGQSLDSREHLKVAQQYFQLVGASASECDTIPGRQCMASCFFILRQFDDGASFHPIPYCSCLLIWPTPSYPDYMEIRMIFKISLRIHTSSSINQTVQQQNKQKTSSFLSHRASSNASSNFLPYT
ncbi:hypothetical protein T492DRAFT_308143 [Pavlovales sp. CCMP2436]|nr:hypothetical protein T492DRAFT_308143 [Pavlovales sp. CCMP2436]